MQFLKTRLNAVVTIALLVFAAILYWSSLPTTAQYLDSSEMVAGGYGLLRVHPPGFPLSIWLLNFWTHFFAVNTVFWRAAFLTSLFALATLALVLQTAKRPLYGVLVVLPLITSAMFWRYAVLPDVFMLNALFAAAICYVYLSWEGSPRKAAFLILLFAIGGTNHTTLIFLLPLVADSFLDRGLSRSSLIAFACGCAIVAIGYCSLIFLSNENPYSWGNVTNPIDALHHLMRKEVGGLNLSAPHDGDEATFFSNLAGGLKLVFFSSPIAALLAALPIFTFKQMNAVDRRRYSSLLVSLCAYLLVFFVMGNVTDELTFEKFYLFPAILILPMAALGFLNIEILIKRQADQPKTMAFALTAVAAVVAAQNFASNRIENDYSWNTIVEDYASNILRMGDGSKTTLVYAVGDTSCFATRYAQVVLGEAPNAYVFCDGILFNEFAVERFKRKIPGLVMDPHATNGNFSRDFLKPNVRNFDVILTAPGERPEFHTTYLGLGKRLSEGSGSDFDLSSIAKLKIRSTTAPLPASKSPDLFKGLFSHYAYIYLKAGLSTIGSDPSTSLSYFETAVQKVPYCLLAIGKTCELKAKLGQTTAECRAQGDEIYETEYNYFK